MKWQHDVSCNSNVTLGYFIPFMLCHLMNPKYKDSTMLNVIFSYAVLLLLITNGSANLAKIMKVSQLKKKEKKKKKLHHNGSSYIVMKRHKCILSSYSGYSWYCIYVMAESSVGAKAGLFVSPVIAHLLFWMDMLTRDWSVWPPPPLIIIVEIAVIVRVKYFDIYTYRNFSDGL